MQLGCHRPYFLGGLVCHHHQMASMWLEASHNSQRAADTFLASVVSVLP